MKKINNKFKLFSAMILTTTPVLAMSISCGANDNDANNDPTSHKHTLDHRAHHSTNAEIKAKGNTWTKRLNTPTATPLKHTWYADETKTIADMLDQMDYQVGFNFKNRIERMSAFDLCKYLVDIYNNNNGGNMSFEIVYKGKKETVSINFEQKLKELITSLDLASPAVDESTAKDNTQTDPMTLGVKIAEKAGHTANPLGWLLGLFQNLGEDVFGFKSILDITKIGDAKVTRAIEIMKLMYALPSQTIERFTQLVSIFNDMANLFKNSPIARQWARDHKFNTDFDTLEHLMVQSIMKSGL